MRDEQGRWLPGESGNPDGRPIDNISILPYIKRKLQEVPPNERRTYAECIATRIVRAAAGEIELTDGATIRDLLDRLDGKPKQTIETHNDLDQEWYELFQEIAGEAREQ